MCSTQPKKKTTFAERVLLLLFGVLLIVLLEGVMRLAGVGDETSLFVRERTATGEEFYVSNEALNRRLFFPAHDGESDFPRPQLPYARFAADKAPGTFRFFVVGASSSVGWPYAPNVAFANWLGEMIAAARPDLAVEGINASMTAISSYQVGRWVREILGRYEPDLIVVYTGHNEFYGVLGAGSAMSVGTNRVITGLFLRLQQTALYSLVASLIETIGRAREGGEQAQPLEALTANRQIRLDSDLHAAVERNFEANLAGMKNAARRKGVPILFCTPASNRADCAPLGPLHRPGFPESDLPRFERLLQSGASHAGLGDFEDAEREYLEALAMDSTHAGVLYRIGRLYLDEEGDQDGPPFLDQALLQDGVRLRASDRLLERIRAVASDEEARAVYLADTAERLRAESAGGAVGSDLVLEHIHPNGRGHYLIASEIFRILKAEGVLGAGAGRELSFTEASERVVYGPLEQAYVAGFMGFMLRRWPFQGTFRNENRIRWMEGEVRRARAEMDPVEGTIFDTRDEGETILHLYHRLGARYLELGEYEKAVRRLSTLVKVVPREPEAQLLLGRALLASGREEEARFALGEALHLGLSRETIASVDPRLAGFLPPPKP